MDKRDLQQSTFSPQAPVTLATGESLDSPWDWSRELPESIQYHCPREGAHTGSHRFLKFQAVAAQHDFESPAPPNCILAQGTTASASLPLGSTPLASPESTQRTAMVKCYLDSLEKQSPQNSSPHSDLHAGERGAKVCTPQSLKPACLRWLSPIATLTPQQLCVCMHFKNRLFPSTALLLHPL